MKKIWIVATYDTKAAEAHYLRMLIARQAPVITVDLSTTPHDEKVDIRAHEIASFHPQGAAAVFTNDRGSAVSAMAEAFKNMLASRDDVGAILGIGGSGGTAMVTPAMQQLPIGIPKIMVSTMASGQVSQYVGISDITMMHSVTDLAGLNRLSKTILANAAGAIVGAFQQVMIDEVDERAAIGLTMFGVTTPCVQQLTEQLADNYESLVFHATGVGGRSMEKLLDDGFLHGIVDLTTTEVCDWMFGGVLACTEDRFGAMIRTQKPAVVSVGALDMINFAAIDTVPEAYRGRLLYQHNSQVTLMRTTAEENAAMGQWIAERINQCAGPVRLLIPQGGVSALDAPGQAFWDPDADRALFAALEAHFKPTSTRQLIMTPHHINSAAFAADVVRHFVEVMS